MNSDLLKTEYLAREDREETQLMAVSWVEPFSDGTSDVHAAVVRTADIPGPFEFKVIAEHAVIETGADMQSRRQELIESARITVATMLDRVEASMRAALGETPKLSTVAGPRP